MITSIGCETNRKVFHKADTSNGDFDFYIVPHPEMAYDDIQYTDLKINNAYKIENSDIVKELIESYRCVDFIPMKSRFRPYYTIEVSKNNRTHSNRWLNKELSYTFFLKDHSIDSLFLLNYKSNFKPLVANVIIINSLSDARKAVDIVQAKGGFLPFHTETSPYHWEKFSGTIELRCIQSEFPKFNTSGSMESYLKNEFADISEVWHNGYNSSITPDSSMIGLYAEYDITEDLPEKYTVSRAWEELTDLQMAVFNLTIDEISAVLNQNNIAFKSIERKNFINTSGIIGAWGNDELGNAEFVFHEDSIYYPDPDFWRRYEISNDTIRCVDENGEIESIQILRLENDTLVLKYIDYDVTGTYKHRK